MYSCERAPVNTQRESSTPRTHESRLSAHSSALVEHERTHDKKTEDEHEGKSEVTHSLSLEEPIALIQRAKHHSRVRVSLQGLLVLRGGHDTRHVVRLRLDERELEVDV